jgi:hypothetical protein
MRIRGDLFPWVVCMFLVAVLGAFLFMLFASEQQQMKQAPVCKPVESRRVACLVVSPDGSIAEAPLSACGDPSTEAGQTWCSFRWTP